MMQDVPITAQRDGLVLTTDRRRIDVGAALALLHATYWAKALTRDSLALAMEHSICFGILDGETLIGFARIVTDLVTYAYWSDVVIAEPYRGRGIGMWLAREMLGHPQLQTLRRVALITRDAASLYARVGFGEGSGAFTYMEYKRSPSGA